MAKKSDVQERVMTVLLKNAVFNFFWNHQLQTGTL